MLPPPPKEGKLMEMENDNLWLKGSHFRNTLFSPDLSLESDNSVNYLSFKKCFGQ